MTKRQPETYDGPVVFVNGVHYPVDEDGHAILKRGLRVSPDGLGYVFAAADAPLHNDTHFQRDAELDVGGEG